MARLRRPRYLTCFYCGRSSGRKYDGLTRNFLCLYCDARNYLDENGEITDPPAAMEGEAPGLRFAASMAPTATNSIFCPTCLKNQHLYTTSLAQYFPDDPSDPDFAYLERNYYRYKRGLEKRYPQVCDECAVKVEGKLRQAGYTAKTDHLRRMMDLGRGRGPMKRRTPLDCVSSLGRATWRAGFVLQMLWHLAAVLQLLGRLASPTGNALVETEKKLLWALDELSRASAYLPPGEKLIQWSIGAAIVSAWWNPHFVQVKRGFTRQLLGLSQWYSFQGLIVFFRLVFRRVVGLQGEQAQSTGAQLSIHAVMAVVMSLVRRGRIMILREFGLTAAQIYVLAGRSIRVEMSPLFATPRKARLPHESPASKQQKDQDSKTFSELFNEALESTNEKSEFRHQPSLAPSPSRFTMSTSKFIPLDLTTGHDANLSKPYRNQSMQQQLDYAEEMDWSPITPQHRTLASQSVRNKSFLSPASSIAVGDLSNPFRHRVPAAPLNPAHRLRNPPRAPVASESPGPKKMLFSSPSLTHAPKEPLGQAHSDGALGRALGPKTGSLEFRDPKFFAPARDDASTLADLLGQSFSLRQDSEDDLDGADDTEEAEEPEDVGARLLQHQRESVTKKTNAGRRKKAKSYHKFPLELCILLLLLAAWQLAAHLVQPYKRACETLTLTIASIMALRDTGDAQANAVGGSSSALLPTIISTTNVAELAVVCWAGSAVWEGGHEAEALRLYGTALLVEMLAQRTIRRLVATT